MPRKATHPIRSLPNLGAKSEAMLRRSGITSPGQLRELGAVKAFVTVRRKEQAASLNLLWALEGALSNRPWQQVAKEDRLSLLLQVEDEEKRAP